MRIRVAYTIDVDDDYRRAIRLYYGASGLATRYEVQAWCEAYGNSMDQDIMRALDDTEGGDDE